MKTHKKRQADYRQRKRDKGMIPKEIWVFEKDWPEIEEVIKKKNKKGLDNVTSDN